jgi:hypothetical protein
MRGGYDKTLNRAFAILLLTCIVLTLSVNIFANVACAYADFSTWANRSLRPCEPAGYSTSGTCTCSICGWRGVLGIGHVGIGDGNVSLMKPGFINDAMKAFNEGLAGNETSSNKTTGNVTIVPQENGNGNGTLVSRDVATGSCPACEQAAAAEEGLTETLLPSLLLAGGIVTEGSPYGITLGRPLPHILNEDPEEVGVLYAKMYGLTMPNGDRIDLGIKSIGYEY